MIDFKDIKFEEISLEQLKLDPENPRLPSSFQKAQKSENEIIDFLLLEEATLELMQAIGENGYFPGEQLLVVLDEEDGKYVVIEGNRRLASVKLLNDYTLASKQKNLVKKVYDNAKRDKIPTKIPCTVFPNKQAILKYLGYRHVTGAQSWKTLSKARYLYNLKNELFKNQENLEQICRELAKMIGSRKDYVKRLLVGYEIFVVIQNRDFYKIANLDDTTIHFFYISDSIKHSNISKFLGVDLKSDVPLQHLHKSNLEKLITWFFKENEQGRTRLKGKSDDLNRLNRVLGSKDAKVTFEEGTSLVEADELTGEIDNTFMNYVKRAITDLEQADKFISRVRSIYPNLVDDLTTIRNLTSKLKRTKESIEENDF